MNGSIKTQSADCSGNGSTGLLCGEIAGVQTFCIRVCKGENRPAETGEEAAILFFSGGEGLIACREQSFPFQGMAVFVPAPKSSYAIEAAADTGYLEIHWALRANERAEFAAGPLPYFSNYSDCKTYSESFKSAKTVNRTVVPKGLVPRFCMGSVQTEGPDAVGAHKHPMLEQHFFGLKDNDVIVRADEEEVSFTEHMLLHIPLGSEHSVRVEPGKKLHYLWLDFFADKEGLSWITTMHTENK